MISAVLSIIVIMFLINETFSLADGKKKYEEGTKITISGSVVPVYMLRLAAFGVCFVLNMTSSFLSVYTSSFWSKGLGISEAMAGAVPLFANGVFSALSALVCPRLMEKAGFRRLAAAGILCSGAGDLLAGLSRGYPSIVLALLLNGLVGAPHDAKVEPGEALNALSDELKAHLTPLVRTRAQSAHGSPARINTP